jgi:hypothetical protein
VQSSRRLEREAGRNVELMWLLGRLVPDHKTVADIRKDNGRAIRKVCARFVELCREMGLLANASVVFVESVYGALLGSCRVHRIELPIALLDSARALVSSNGDADMVRANPLARGGDFLLRLASRQGKDLIAEAWRAAIDASRFRRCRAPAST